MCVLVPGRRVLAELSIDHSPETRAQLLLASPPHSNRQRTSSSAGRLNPSRGSRSGGRRALPANRPSASCFLAPRPLATARCSLHRAGRGTTTGGSGCASSNSRVAQSRPLCRTKSAPTAAPSTSSASGSSGPPCPVPPGPGTSDRWSKSGNGGVAMSSDSAQPQSKVRRFFQISPAAQLTFKTLQRHRLCSRKPSRPNLPSVQLWILGSVETGFTGRHRRERVRQAGAYVHGNRFRALWTQRQVWQSVLLASMPCLRP